MEIRYKCECYDRTLVIKLPENYEYLREETNLMLDQFYDEWVNFDGMADELYDMCLEEYMMERYSETYAVWDEWYVEED